MQSNQSLIENHKDRYAKAVHAAKQKGEHTFHSWFNKSNDLNQTIVRGFWDFSLHILTSNVCAVMDHPEEKVALEIGYGGGRILNAACSYFKEVIGVDIHDEEEAVRAFLHNQGKRNFRLILGSGNSLEVQTESIDFVYSFIVFQHLPTYQVFEKYLYETYRCLKIGGVAQLYYGKFSKLGLAHSIQYFWQGYYELTDAPVNFTSLVVRNSKVRKLCRFIGFHVVNQGTSYKNVPDGYLRKKGGQNYITLIK
jgi:ubiquinone/menaquinone biosynthesis C-methylase UbiE